MSWKSVVGPNLEGERDSYAQGMTPILEDFARLEEQARRRFVNKGKYNILHGAGDKEGWRKWITHAMAQDSDWLTGKQLCWERCEV